MRIICLLLLIICSYTDLRERGISLVLLAASLISCAALMISVEIYGNSCKLMENWLIYKPELRGILCALIPGTLLLIVCRLSREAIGMGDVYVMLILGLMLGFANTMALMFISMVITALFGVFRIIRKGGSRKESLPYMPFLLGGYLLMLCTGMIRTG